MLSIWLWLAIAAGIYSATIYAIIYAGDIDDDDAI